ncbi:MAG: VOC family protein, partial [Steroidobacteraceae bacterium]
MDQSAAAATYEVGGVRMARPFRVRRLGHFGLNVDRTEACVHFYRRHLGLRLADCIDYREIFPQLPEITSLGDPHGYFLRHGTDHHSFVLFDRKVRTGLDREQRFRDGVTVNQITFQVGSLAEVVEAHAYLGRKGVRISRAGRDTPGSNWHTYFFDPDGHTVELFYGIEQIGWNGRSKPKAMYDRGFKDLPPLPQLSESAEVADASARGVDLDAGAAQIDRPAAGYDVDGVVLGRPFVVSGIGPARIFVTDLERSLDFYVATLGLTVTERTRVLGEECAFLRANTEHHCLALYPIVLRAALGLWEGTTLLSFGFRLSSYAQLRQAVMYLQSLRFEPVRLAGALSPGMGHHAFFREPSGHLV